MVLLTSGSALLTLIALVASIDGNRATVEGEFLHYLRPGDVGQVSYELTVESESKTIEVGTAEVVNVEGSAVEVQLTSDQQVLPGHTVRFEVPFERALAQAQLEAVGEVGEAEAPPVATDPQVTIRAPLIPTAVQLEARVRAWARAWASRDVGAYLSFYAAAYQPRDTSREQWAVERGQRLRAPEFIEISISAFELLSATPEHAEVRFEQGYRSDSYQDRVTKTLELVLDGGEWKITEEEAQ